MDSKEFSMMHQANHAVADLSNDVYNAERQGKTHEEILQLYSQLCNAMFTYQVLTIIYDLLIESRDHNNEVKQRIESSQEYLQNEIDVYAKIKQRFANKIPKARKHGRLYTGKVELLEKYIMALKTLQNQFNQCIKLALMDISQLINFKSQLENMLNSAQGS